MDFSHKNFQKAKRRGPKMRCSTYARAPPVDQRPHFRSGMCSHPRRIHDIYLRLRQSEVGNRSPRAANNCKNVKNTQNISILTKEDLVSH